MTDDREAIQAVAREISSLRIGDDSKAEHFEHWGPSILAALRALGWQRVPAGSVVVQRKGAAYARSHGREAEMTDWAKAAADEIDALLHKGQWPRADRIAAIIRRHAPDAEWRLVDWLGLGRPGSDCLVYLSQEFLGSRMHVMTSGKVSLIGGHFSFDAPRPTHYRPLPNPPEGA